MLPCLALSGCFLFGRGGPPEGDDDMAPSPSCTADFELALECELTGDLMVELGQGEVEYEALKPGWWPELYTVAGFQGGGSSHYELGVRVENHAIDFPNLKVQFELLLCEDDEPECGQWSRIEGRLCHIDGDDLEYTEDGGAQVTGVNVFADEFSGDRVAVAATVDDPCGRTGSAMHVLD